jgi:hypothetical protein
VEHERGLLLRVLDGNKAHGRAGHRFTDAFSIKCITFAAFDIEFHIGRRHEPDLVTEGRQLTRPEVGRGARLHANQSGWRAREDADYLSATHLPADQNLSILIDTVDLKHMLGEIETYCRDLHWSGSLSGAEAKTLSHSALPGAGAADSIIYGTDELGLNSTYKIGQKGFVRRISVQLR